MAYVARALWGIVATAVVATTAPNAAAAKDLCVKGVGEEVYVFQSVKKLKTGRAVPILGFWRLADEAVPIFGTAMREASGVIEVAVVVPGLSALQSFAGNISIVNMEVDALFTGGGAYDANGDFLSDSSYAWTAIDCKTVVLP